jgi:hypothetical protein
LARRQVLESDFVSGMWESGSVAEVTARGTHGPQWGENPPHCSMQAKISLKR